MITQDQNNAEPTNCSLVQDEYRRAVKMPEQPAILHCDPLDRSECEPGLWKTQVEYYERTEPNTTVSSGHPAILNALIKVRRWIRHHYPCANIALSRFEDTWLVAEDGGEPRKTVTMTLRVDGVDDKQIDEMNEGVIDLLLESESDITWDHLIVSII